MFRLKTLCERNFQIKTKKPETQKKFNQKMSLDGYLGVAKSAKTEKSKSTASKSTQKKARVCDQPPKVLLQLVESRVSAAVKPLCELASALEKTKNDVTGKLIAMVAASCKERPDAKPHEVAEYTVWSFIEHQQKRMHEESDRAFYRREKAEREAIVSFIQSYLFDLDRSGPITGWIKRNNLLNLELFEEIGGALTDAGKQSDENGKQYDEWSDSLTWAFAKATLSCIRADDEMKKTIGKLLASAAECDDEERVEKYSKRLYKLLSEDLMFESEKEKQKRIERQQEAEKPETKATGKRKKIDFSESDDGGSGDDDDDDDDGDESGSEDVDDDEDESASESAKSEESEKKPKKKHASKKPKIEKEDAELDETAHTRRQLDVVECNITTDDAASAAKPAEESKQSAESDQPSKALPESDSKEPHQMPIDSKQPDKEAATSVVVDLSAD